jgi:hypothetical protein
VIPIDELLAKFESSGRFEFIEQRKSFFHPVQPRLPNHGHGPSEHRIGRARPGPDGARAKEVSQGGEIECPQLWEKALSYGW